MSKAVRLIDIADASDTSIKTVSRVLNNDPRVSDETRTRVQRKIDELGYQVDLIARSLRTGVDNVLGVIIQRVGDPFFAEVVEEIEIEANRRGIGVIVGSTHGDLERENELVQGFKQRRVAGLVIAPQDVDYSFMESVRIPTVFIDRAPLNFKGDVVRVDDLEGGRIATNHLIKHGHKKIAFFGDREKVKTTKLRLDGYKKALNEAKIKFEEDLIFLDMEEERKAESVMNRILTGDNQPTAIFASKSELAAGLLRAIHSKKRTDIAIISFDDFRFADTLTPAISVLDHSSRDLARVAVMRLFSKMDGINSPTTEEILPLKVIERGSGELRPKL
jgi:LacI family transcriptional regulator